MNANLAVRFYGAHHDIETIRIKKENDAHEDANTRTDVIGGRKSIDEMNPNTDNQVTRSEEDHLTKRENGDYTLGSLISQV